MSGTKKQKIDLLRGTLDLMILRILDLQPLHGIAIADRIRQSTNGAFNIQAGSLFPALHRLEQEGWVEGEWGESENRRKAKYYTVTAAGRKRLKEEAAGWKRLATAMTAALAATPDEV